MPKVECLPQAACALFKICQKLVEVDPNPHEPTEAEADLSRQFDQVVDDSGKSAQILGNQDDPTCVPFNHSLRNKTVGAGSMLNTTIFWALLSRTFAGNNAAQEGWFKWDGGKGPLAPDKQG